MLTLEEAILHAEEIAEAEEQKYKEWKGDYSHLKKIDSCLECASEHRQLAEWLRELKAYRGILANADKLIESEYGCVIIEGYADVLDKMNEVFKEVKADGDSD